MTSRPSRRTMNRLVYEVRLLKVGHKKSDKWRTRWRWDVIYYLTTDPEFPGVETGRQEIHRRSWGYTRFKWQALKNISDAITKNVLRETIDER